MKKLLCLLFVSTLVACSSDPAQHHSGPRHGELRGTTLISAWDANRQVWVSPESFWLSDANARGGLTWGQGTTYPNYNDVSEFDSFIVELPQGVCSMTFYHSRWRRSNDVWRWDEGHNQYSACPYVFDH